MISELPEGILSCEILSPGNQVYYGKSQKHKGRDCCQAKKPACRRQPPEFKHRRKKRNQVNRKTGSRCHVEKLVCKPVPSLCLKICLKRYHLLLIRIDRNFRYKNKFKVEKQKQERQRCCRSGENKFPFLPSDNQMSNSQHGNFGYDKCGCHFLGEVGYEADHAKQHRHKQDCPYPDSINNSPAKCSKNEEIKGSLTEKQAVRSCINRI
ncbi:MAG: hypothetical protein SPL25_03635 [Succinivibrionaceae bacterium]|nr:hypothetical protein [Succinivibrionaceae bacterium]